MGLLDIFRSKKTADAPVTTDKKRWFASVGLNVTLIALDEIGGLFSRLE